MHEPQFIPSVEIQFCGPDGEKHTRKLRFDLAARRVLRTFYIKPDDDPEEADKIIQKRIDADQLLFFIRALFAMTYHERIDGEGPESFESFIGIQNLAYIGKCISEAMGMGRIGEDEEENPTPAPNGSEKRSPTGKSLKRSPKSASALVPDASIQ